MASRAALVVVFNHRYDKNIAKLETLYRGRFSHVRYLVPFYDGDHPDVIAVYENSYRFQGYIAQARTSFFKEEFDHYLFVADDLILHPAINEENYREHFGLDAPSGFIPELFEVHRLRATNTLRFEAYQDRGQTHWYWWRLIDLVNYRHRVEGIENADAMPSYDAAAAILREHGFGMGPVKFADAYGPFPTKFGFGRVREHGLGYLKRLRHYRQEYRVDYPVVASFSDLAVVPKSSIRRFAHYCGVFAANGLFVEFALPTALLLSCKDIVTEQSIGKHGQTYWLYTPEEKQGYQRAMAPYDRDLHRLLNDFPADKLYIHPVKLSQWNV